jgi:hypothetical protein
MIRYNLSGVHHPKDQPEEFVVYNHDEIRNMLIDNCSLAVQYENNPDKFIVVKTGNPEAVKLIFATLVREVFEGNTGLITYLPIRKLMYIYYGPKLNWIKDLKQKIKRVITRIHAGELKTKGARDKWGEILISNLGGEDNGD